MIASKSSTASNRPSAERTPRASLVRKGRSHSQQGEPHDKEQSDNSGGRHKGNPGCSTPDQQLPPVPGTPGRGAVLGYRPKRLHVGYRVALRQLRQCPPHLLCAGHSAPRPISGVNTGDTAAGQGAGRCLSGSRWSEADPRDQPWDRGLSDTRGRIVTIVTRVNI